MNRFCTQKIRWHIVLGLTAMASFLGSPCVLAEIPLEYDISWTKTLTAENNSSFWDYVDVGRDGQILAVEKSIDVATSANARYWLWEIEASGAVQSRREIDDGRPAEVLGSNIPGSVATILRQKDGFLVVGRIKDEERYSLIKLNSEGTVESSRWFAEKLPHVEFKSACRLDSGDVVLAGAWGRECIAMGINSQAEIAWVRAYDQPRSGRSSELSNVVAINQGEQLLFAGQSGLPDKYGLGPWDVWLIECDRAGAVQREQFFPGRSPSIGSTSIGGLIPILFDVNTTTDSDSRLGMLDAKLQMIWEKQIDVASEWAYPPSANVRKDNVVVAGVVGNQLRIREFDRQGNQTKRLERTLDGFAGTVRLFTNEGELIAVITEYRLKSGSDFPVSVGTILALSDRD
jgi:hypothetical protein